MERSIFRWLTGAGAVAAAITMATDAIGPERSAVVSGAGTRTERGMTIVIIGNPTGGDAGPAVCLMAQVGE